MATTGSKRDHHHGPGASAGAESLPGIPHIISVGGGKGAPEVVGNIDTTDHASGTSPFCNQANA